MVTRSHEASQRTCIVTRQALPVDALIRFAVAPDGTVVPDLRRRLPGRGVWVTASARHVETAVRKRLFARAFGGPVNVDAAFTDSLDTIIESAALSALSLARKAGSLVAGFAKVEAALTQDPVVGIIHARDATADGIGRLAQAARRRFGKRPPPVIRCFAADQLDLALGRTNVIHAALLAGPASDNALARVQALADYRGEPSVPDDAGNRKTNAPNESSEASAGL